MIRLYFVLTTIAVAGLEVEPREEIECQSNVCSGVIILIYIVLIMVISDDVTVVWKTIKVSQTETILLLIIVNRYERRNHVSLLKRVLRLTAVCVFEVHISIKVDNAL